MEKRHHASLLQALLHFDSFILFSGAGFDGVEEIKRHPFFVTIDWNVSGAVLFSS